MSKKIVEEYFYIRPTGGEYVITFNDEYITHLGYWGVELTKEEVRSHLRNDPNLTMRLREVEDDE